MSTEFPTLAVTAAESLLDLIRLNADALDEKAREFERLCAQPVLSESLVNRTPAIMHRACAQVLRELSELADSSFS